MEELTLNVSVDINAPAAIVWQGLTDAEMIKKYFFGTQAISDWQEGSPLIFKGEWQGKEYMDKGTILKSEPGKLLKYKYWSSMSGMEDKPENYANITYQLKPQGGQTLLTVTQEGIKTEEQKQHSEQNWKMVLDGLKNLLENK